MAAHLRPIRVPKCAWQNCPKAATQTLHNTWNAVIGDYCTKHATQALKAYAASEEVDLKRRNL